MAPALFSASQYKMADKITAEKTAPVGVIKDHVRFPKSRVFRRFKHIPAETMIGKRPIFIHRITVIFGLIDKMNNFSVYYFCQSLSFVTVP